MQTKKAAAGHWGRIFEYYGMPPVTGLKHYSGPCRYVVPEVNFAVMIRMVPVHGFVSVVTGTG